MMKLSVYVTEIRKQEPGVLVTATNGSPSGPPCIEWMAYANMKDIYIGKRFDITITDPEVNNEQ
jgi:hypothetical protein